MTAAHRLQLVYNSLPDASIQSKVLEFLLDREVVSAAQAKEQAMDALVAWLAGDALRINGTCSSQEYSRALTVAIASLEARATYYRTLLEMTGGIAASPPTQVGKREASQFSAPIGTVSDRSTAKVDVRDFDGEAPTFSSDSPMSHLFEGIEG